VGKLNREELPIYVVADRSTIGYISALTKTDAKMVLVNMRDMANKAIERLKHRKHGKHTWTNITYPGCGMRFRVTVDITQNHKLRSEHEAERMNLYLSEGGIPYIPSTGRWRSKNYKASNAVEHREAYHAWTLVNPSPYKDFNYECIVVTFIYKTDKDQIMISQDEIDTILIEEILFAQPSSEEEDE
jgi:hypothetical protein